ncbi:MAG: beta-propeller domain-containing protein [Myxococcaceae bacterium]
MGVQGEDGAMNASAGGSAPPSAPTNYTTTNTQVSGVDEADFIKNDGTRIFVLSGDTLYANQSWPASALSTAGKLKIEGWPREMFLDGQNNVVVFSSIWTEHPLDQASSRGGMAYRAMYWGYYYANTVKVTVVDVSDLGNPRVTNQFYLPGQYSNSRRIGSSVRLVLTDSFRFPPKMQWYPEYSQGLYEDKSRLAKAYDQLIAENTTLIRGQALSDWLPASKVTTADGVSVDLAMDCTQFHKTNAPTKLGVVTIATLNLSTPTQMNQTSIIGEAGEVYASASSLYVANRHWWWWPAPGQQDATYVHKFDISSPDEALYVASGKVDGHIVDQFSMDEDSRGFFRVASTISKRVADPTNTWGRMTTTNRVFVMGEQSGSLKVVGQTPEMAPGERITSSRFVGDNKAFVVSFRQVDPLFSLDMADPTNPRIVGELKIPGFSTYIHPIDEGHLLTIGTYQPDCTTVPGQNCWQARALQLAIFDVTDMTSPKQSFVQLVGTAYSWSEAQQNHKAFNYFPAKKLLAIPFYDWNYGGTGSWSWSNFTSELRVYGVDTAAGFTPKGALSMKDMYQSYNDWGWCYYWNANVRRSVMADDFVYAISDVGVRVANIADLSTPLASVSFTKAVDQ